MKILLVIGYVWPEPHSSAAGSHMLSILRLFKRNSWRVVFSTPAQKTDYNHDLSLDDIEEKEINLNDSTFDSYVCELNPTVVLFDRFMMEEQFGWRVAESCPDALRVLDTEDLQCLRSARHVALKENRKFTYDDLQTDLAKREIASIYRCDLSLIVSDFEKSLLTDYFSIGDRLLVLLPFMVDLSQIEKDTPSYSQRTDFITIGNLRHAPNWDSILYLQEIWPLIRVQLPNAELHIYGAYTPPKATALDNPNNGFVIRDRAINVAKVMADSRVCLSPLRFGAGIKGKFIDAMLTSTPCVTTAIGSEGMSSDKDWPGIVANDPQKIADAAVSLYKNENLWNLHSQQCTKLLKKKYCAISNGEKLMNLINELLKNIDTHRQNNFIGGMLNFHTARSTKYMSKWIEEKNKKT